MFNRFKTPILGLFIFVLLTISYQSTFAQDGSPQQDQNQEKKPEYSPYIEIDFPQQVYWGDTHHHSSYSFDSGMFGNTLGESDEGSGSGRV